MNTSGRRIPTIGDLSEHNANNVPTRDALVDDHQRLTWEEFHSLAIQTGNAYQNYLRKGDRVAMLCGPSVDHAILWDGAIKSGAIATNIHTLASLENILYCLDEVMPTVLVIDEEYSELVEEEIRPKIPAISTVVTIGEPRAEYEQSVDAFRATGEAKPPDTYHDVNDIAVIAWTSGTTGRPKGWCHTHRTLFLNGRGGMSGASRRMTSASPSFSAWMVNYRSVASTGSTLVFLESWDPQRWATQVERERISVSGLVTSMWRDVLDLDLREYDLSSLEQVIFTGEKIDPNLLRDVRETICSNVVNAYASTEMPVASISGDHLEEQPDSVGTPMGGTEVRIVEEGGSPDDEVPSGESGEILVKSPGRPIWVWHDTETTNEEFVDGWWRSGDLGYRDQDDRLYVLGRTDSIIMSKGVKVVPKPIEEHLRTHPAVAEAIVIGVDDEEYGEKVTAVVRTENSVTSDELDEWCLGSEQVARHERPRTYHFVDEPLPRSSSEKTDRNAVAERFRS